MKLVEPFYNNNEQPAAAPPPPLPYIDMLNWDHTPVPDQEWSVPNRVPKYETAIHSGQGAAGKSTIQLHLSAAHVLGREWLKSLPEKGPAIFFDAEDAEGVMHRRLAAIIEHYGVTFEDLIKGGLHLMSFAGKDAVLAAATRNGKIEPTALFKQMLEACGDIKPRMLSIASVSNVYAGSEINRSQVQQFVSLMTRLAIVAQGAVTLITHPSLTGINTDTGCQAIPNGTTPCEQGST